MKKTEFDIREMSDSREVYGERPNPFFSWFIYVLAGILAAALIYSFFGKIEVVAKAAGIIRPNEDVSTVTSLVSGRVVSVSYQDGQTVSKGDELLKLDLNDSEILLKSYQDTKEKNEKEKEFLQRFLAGMDTGKNPFSSDPEGEEYLYYSKFRNYLLSLKNTEQNQEFNEGSNTENLSACREQVKKLETQISGLEAYKESIEQGQNLASDYPEYSDQYELYAATLEKLRTEYETSRESNAWYLSYYRKQKAGYDLLIRSIENGVSCFSGEKDEFEMMYEDYLNNIETLQLKSDNAERTYRYYSEDGGTTGHTATDSYNTATARISMESADVAVDAYKNSILLKYRQTLAEIENKLFELEQLMTPAEGKAETENRLKESYDNSVAQQKLTALTQATSSIESLKAELKTAQTSLTQYELTDKLYREGTGTDGKPLAVSQAEAEQRASVLNSIDSLETALRQLETSIGQSAEQVGQGTITAEKDGVINEVKTVVAGDVITSGETIATIIPAGESEYKVHIYVSSSDIGNVKNGDRVRYNITALPSSQYGIPEGKVLSISKDALVSDGQYSGYFLVVASIDKSELHDRDGNTGTITIGMQTEAKIVTQEKSIIRYLLEKINLF